MAILAVSVAFGFQPKAEEVGLKAQPTTGADLRWGDPELTPSGTSRTQGPNLVQFAEKR